MGVSMCVCSACAITQADDFPVSVDSQESPAAMPAVQLPAVQMLVPGFHVRRLPIELPNCNNVQYRHDGALVALGYNGDVYILKDTDGDRLEDTSHVYYKNNGSLLGPIGMRWTPTGDPRGPGLFVASKGKVSFLFDRDGDDVADGEQVIASGWDPLPVNVDAVGMAIGPDGSIYFGLGTTDYSNAYLVDDAGHAGYDPKGERGTIQRIYPDFKKRETICSGVRFPIGIAFHRDGELFCTDQEGATWLPNGNPFDELLHIRTGKHYGFPPRHPNHNPDVIDEPSVFDYGPQHQSTCGFFFNASAEDPARFGPIDWSDNAIVCGESRGKLWRTQLVRTDAGYIAQTQLIAALQELTVDACPTPSGGMVVACHSGPPDWGTGPAGIGNLYKITAYQSSIPRPVSAWFASPNEIHIAFDSVLDPTGWRNVANRIRLEAGVYVRAGDSLETLKPPYAVVQAQGQVPSRSIEVFGVGFSPDFRSLILQIPPQTTDETYAIELPSNAIEPLASAIAQLPIMAIDLRLHGVMTHWKPKDASYPSWTGTLPHMDLSVARALTQSSAEHAILWQSMQNDGVLTMETSFDARGILRPKIQPGASIDYVWPNEQVTLAVTPASPALQVACRVGERDIPGTRSGVDQNSELRFELSSASDVEAIAALKWTIDWTAGQAAPVPLLRTQEDTTPRAIPLHRFRLPWMSQQGAMEVSVADDQVAGLEGGSWGRGRRIFYSSDTRCAQCHEAPGSGMSRLAPDLANLIHRDRASVLRDIIHPSYAINPDFLSQHIQLDDGTVLTGILSEQEGGWTLTDSQAIKVSIGREKVVQIRPSAASNMPVGLLDKRSQGEIQDLLTYLMTQPPHMPIEGPLAAPKLRTAQEVADVLAGSAVPSAPYRPLTIVLVAGPKDHGPGEHDYPAWMVQWGQLLAAAESVTVETAWEFPESAQMERADILIFFQKGAWNPDRATAMDAYFERGGGATYLHWAVNGDDRVADFSQRIGLASHGGNIRYRHGPLTLRLANSQHPILRNVHDLELLDESYWLLTGDPERIDLLATSLEDESPRPQLWTFEPGNGRTFVSIPGHYNWTFDDPIFRTILLRGMAWTAREPVDRFNEVVRLGARMSR